MPPVAINATWTVNGLKDLEKRNVTFGEVANGGVEAVEIDHHKPSQAHAAGHFVGSCRTEQRFLAQDLRRNVQSGCRQSEGDAR
jgi:hypothetical protein